MQVIMLPIIAPQLNVQLVTRSHPCFEEGGCIASNSPVRTKTLTVIHNISVYSMYTSSMKKLATYCSENNKPKPCYQHTLEGGKYTAEVYVARTCGSVAGDAQPSVSEAEGNAAETLAKKLCLF